MGHSTEGQDDQGAGGQEGKNIQTFKFLSQSNTFDQHRLSSNVHSARRMSRQNGATRARYSHPNENLHPICFTKTQKMF